MFEFAKTPMTDLDHDLVAAHAASGQPRYSNTLYLAGGGFIRRWSDDEQVARLQLESDRADPNLAWAIAFDHHAVWTLDVAFPPHSKTAEELKAECDEALDRMFDRWLAEGAAGSEGGH